MDEELSYEGSEIQMPISVDPSGKSVKRSVGRKRKSRNDSSSVVSKKYVRAMNKKYIDEVKRKSVFPETFIYTKLISSVKKNLKEFFIDPNDLVQNSNGQINRKKGGKKMLSQGAYEYGDGFFDLKFDGRIGVRANFNPKDKKNRLPVTNINKSNHFWWLISKAYLNKFLLEDARNSLNTFIAETDKDNELFKHTSEEEQNKHNKVQALFKPKCLDFETLVKNDPDLQGLDPKDIPSGKSFTNFPLLDDKLWWDESAEEDETANIEAGVEFY